MCRFVQPTRICDLPLTQQLCDLGVVRRTGAGPLHNAQVRKAAKFRPAMPVMQYSELIHADDQTDRDIRHVRPQRGERVHSERRPVAIKLPRINLDPRLIHHSFAQHTQALRGACNRLIPMRRLADRHQPQLIESEEFQKFKSHTQVAMVHRIKGTAEDAYSPHTHPCRAIISVIAAALIAHVTVAKYNKLLRRQTFDANGTARVDLVGADTNLRAQTILEAIREAGGRIDHD